jgi:putrescine transport system permease protein
VIFSKVKLGVSPDINALATLIIAIVGVGVLVAGVLMRRADQRHQRDLQLAAQ